MGGFDDQDKIPIVFDGELLALKAKTQTRRYRYTHMRIHTL